MLKHTILLTTLLILASVSIANDPVYGIPWPVGSTEEMMNETKPLMNGYGDHNNNDFHTGIDIDDCTEPEDGNCVRCVEDGVIGRIRHIGTSSGYFVVVIPTPSSQYGWCYGHLKDPAAQGWFEGRSISEGALIDTMINTPAMDPHVHFSWVDKDSVNTCLVNPLDYLVPEPEGSDYWHFVPEPLTPEFKHMFLPEDYADEWPTIYTSVGVVEQNIIPDDDLAGNVDFFFGVTLQGGDAGGTDDKCFVDCAPERVYWKLIREKESGPETLSENYVVNFVCPLTNDDETAEMFTFYWLMHNLFGGNKAGFMCLTNCGDTQGWENLGIDNIEENSWRTNKNYAYLNETTINPVLAEYPDGSYSIDVTCYAHVNDIDPTPNPEVTFDASIPCELHNFSPALRKVSIIDLVTSQTYYHGEWEPNDLSADLLITVNEQVDAGAELQVILWFTEEMNTSQGISVILGPLSVGNGEWSSSVVPNDTWTGEVSLPVELTDGAYTLLVSALDTDNTNLMNPRGEGTVPGPAYDCHHALNLQFAAGVEWTRSLHDDVHGSPKLADIDDDGDMEIALISIDGWGDLLGDDGYSLAGWPVDNYFSPGDPVVTASPGIADFTGSSVPEIVCMSEFGNYIRNTNGILAFSAGWFRWTVNCSPVIGDFDGDNQNEFMIGRQYQSNISHYFNLTARDTDGSTMWYDDDLGPNSSITATPSICNLDNMGGLEVVAVTDATEYSQTDACGTVYCYSASNGNDRWSTNVGGNIITSAVVTANTDDDSVIEVIVAGVSAGGNQVKVLQGDTGLVEATFTVSGSVDAGVSIADINQDGYNDIVLSSSGNGGTLYCWGWDGDSYEDVPGFPLNLGTWTDDGVSIADIDSDSQLELVIAGKDGNLHVINHDGTVTSGFPLAISGCNSLSGQPAIGDIDSDGRLEIVFFELNAAVIHCVELGDNTANNYLPWPQFQHNAQNTGYFPTDLTPPAKPTDFEGEGELAGAIFTAYLSWTLSVNDPDFEPIPTPPADVINYRIYRQLWPAPYKLVGTVSAGISSYTDVIELMAFFPVVCYRISAWDGVNESELTDKVKIVIFGLDNIAAGCPIREITHSAEAGFSSTHASIAVEAGSSSSIESEQRSNCIILTDGEYDAVYTPFGMSDCVEIDLGAVFTVNAVMLSRVDQSISGSLRYELSVDGRTFADTDTGRARYVRVYSVAGASEIEIFGSLNEESSSLIDIQRGVSGGYRIASAEAGSPLAVSVFDLSGRRVWSSTSSTGEVLWNRCSSSGSIVPAGVYLIMVESDDTATFTAKVVVR